MAGGRPTKYEGEVTIEKAKKYLDFDLYGEVEIEEVVKGKVVKKKIKKPNSIPSIAGMALFLDVSRFTIYEWQKNHPEFSDILDQLQLKQEHFLVHHGLLEGYNANFAKFITQNVTNFRDKKEIEQTNITKTPEQLIEELPD